MSLELKKNILLIAYVLSVLTYLSVRLLDYNDYALIIQPFMMIFLGAYYLVATNKVNNMFLLALLFILVGSIFFIYSDSIESFITALIFIFSANMLFLLLIVHNMGIIKVKDILISAGPIYLVLLVLVCSFFTVLLGVKVIIFMYSISLALLLSFAILQKRSSSKFGNLLMLIGIVFMIIRDFFTGLSKLLQREDHFYIVINVLCHALAMFLVCKALLVNSNSTIEKKNIKFFDQ